MTVAGDLVKIFYPKPEAQAISRISQQVPIFSQGFMASDARRICPSVQQILHVFQDMPYIAFDFGLSSTLEDSIISDIGITLKAVNAIP